MKKAIKFIIIVVLLLVAWKAASFWFFKDPPLDFSGEKTVGVDDNGFKFLLSAKAATVGELFEQADVELGQHDLAYPSEEAKLMPGMNITIDRAIPVVIQVDDQQIEHHTFKRTVEDTLQEAGVTLSHLDKTEPARKAGVEQGLEIVVTRINVEQVIVEESIEYDTIEQEDKKLRWRKKKVEQEGVEGVKEVEYEVTYKNGKQVSKEKLSTKIVQEPTDEIVRIGTKVEVGKTKVGIASWYAHTGTMACASRMFPRGTWLRVTNRENGKQVFVQVNDYGPQRGTGKMIDLDKVAFAKLAPIGKGVIEVKVEEILE